MTLIFDAIILATETKNISDASKNSSTNANYSTHNQDHLVHKIFYLIEDKQNIC